MMFLLDETASDFCARTASIWGVLGYVILLLKIIIPLLLIVLGMVDLGKAVISSDDKAISKSVSTLAKRFIAAITIFFIPTIVSAIFNAVVHIDIQNSDYNICVQCVVNRSNYNCNSTFDTTNNFNATNNSGNTSINNNSSNNSTASINNIDYSIFTE